MLQCIYIILQVLNIELNIGVLYLKYQKNVTLYTRKGEMDNDIGEVFLCIFVGMLINCYAFFLLVPVPSSL